MSDADDLTVEWFDATTAHRGDEPALTIYTNLNGYVNAAADRQWFDGIEYFDLGAVLDEGLLAFRPTSDGHYQFSREEGYGADVSVTAAIKHYWGDLELAETAQVPMREHGDLIVADLSELLDSDEPTCYECGATLGKDWRVADAEAREEGTHPADCPECGENPLHPVGEGADGGSDGDDLDDFAPDLAAGDGALDGYHTTQPLVEEYLAHALREGQREFTSSAIADAITGGPDDIAVGQALRQLKTDADAPFAVRKTDKSESQAAIWHVEPDAALAAELGAGGTRPVAEPETEDGPGYVDLEALGCTETALKDAIEGATTVLDVQRALGLQRDAVVDVLEAIGLLDGLEGGRGPVDRGEVQDALRTVEVRE